MPFVPDDRLTHAQLAEAPGVAFMSMILFLRFTAPAVAVDPELKKTPAPPKADVLAVPVRVPDLPRRIVLWKIFAILGEVVV